LSFDTAVAVLLNVVCFAAFDNLSHAERIVIQLILADTDINRVSKELPTGEELSTRMLVVNDVVC